MEAPAQFTPTQARLFRELQRESEPVVFDPDFVDDLVDRANAGMEDLSARLAGEQRYVSKHFITSALGCEVQHLLPDDFAWTPSNAAGFVAHKALELQSNWRGEPVPAELVDEALARLSDQGSSRGDYVAGLTDADHATLRGLALERVTRFQQDFPPIPATAHPMYEASTRWSPTSCIDASSKADLVFGKPNGRISTRVIVDFKTGRPADHHRLDLRFYALLETIVRKVPPRRLVTYYLDYAQADVELVTEATLESALARVLAAVERDIELKQEQRSPVMRPGAACRWCALKATCTEGRAYLADTDLDLSQGFDDAPLAVVAVS